MFQQKPCTQSNHFVYIENQFFITQSIHQETNVTNIVKNKIGFALRKRIVKAHRANEPFFVMIFIPLLPAFSGDIIESRILFKKSRERILISRDFWNYIFLFCEFPSIYASKQITSTGRSLKAVIILLSESLIELLKYDGVPNPEQYIKFFSLRNHGVTPSQQLPVCEMIYIHSKTLIVDDCAFVVGSANINDRSMLGSRDHEMHKQLNINFCMVWYLPKFLHSINHGQQIYTYIYFMRLVSQCTWIPHQTQTNLTTLQSP